MTEKKKKTPAAVCLAPKLSDTPHSLFLPLLLSEALTGYLGKHFRVKNKNIQLPEMVTEVF